MQHRRSRAAMWKTWLQLQGVQLCASCSASCSKSYPFKIEDPVVILVTIPFDKKCTSKRIYLICSLRLSNGVCERNTSVRQNNIYLSCIFACFSVHASKDKRQLCSTWLTFTTLGSWAPMSNPSIDQEGYETMNLSLLFLSAHGKWALQMHYHVCSARHLFKREAV